MTTYSDDFKASIVAKLLPPRSLSVPQLVKETGIPPGALPNSGLLPAGPRRLAPVGVHRALAEHLPSMLRSP